MKELAFWTRIYLKMKDGETQAEAEQRMLDAIEGAGLDWLDANDEMFEVLDD